MSGVVNREEFLSVLESVSPGLTPADDIEQSSFVILADGKATTFNGEVSCTAPSLLEDSIRGAVPAAPLIELLGKIKDEELSVETTENKLIFRGKRRKKTELLLKPEITLDTSMIDYPSEWIPLHEDFLDAIEAVQECAGGKGVEFRLTCIHLHSKWIEACDGTQIMRFSLETGLLQPVLVKRDAVKGITTLGMTEFGETRNWIHFRNANQAILSCRRYAEEYMDVGKFLNGKNKGEKLELPKNLIDATEAAEIFTKEAKDKALLKIQLLEDEMRVIGKGSSGRHFEPRKIAYAGKPFSFMISPKIFSSIIKKHSSCQISETKLVVEGERWKYVTSLSRGDQ